MSRFLSMIPMERLESKEKILDSISTDLDNKDIGYIIKKRKHYKNAEKRLLTYSTQKQKNNLKKRLKSINNIIVKKLTNTSKDIFTPEIEQDLYYIYKNNNIKEKISNLLKKKNISRTLSKTYSDKSTKYTSIKKGLSSFIRSASNMTGLTTYSVNRLKKLKGDIQILRKQKNDLMKSKKLNNNQLKLNNNQLKLNNINKKITIIKNEIKKAEGMNYDETLENYSNVMFKNYSKFDLDGEYNKLLLKSHLIKIYKNLLTTNELTTNKVQNSISMNTNSKSLFDNDNELFKNLSSSVPYSEYNFLYGIDKHSSLGEERLIALLYLTKIIFAFFLEPHYLAVTTISVISLLLSRFALDYYRKYKRTLKKNIIFCVKYFAFDGIEHFSSELIAKYHKIMYYGKKSDDEKNKKFYESVIDLSENEEENFIKKNILFIKYLEEYKENIKKNDNKKIDSSISSEILKNIESKLGKQVKEQENDHNNNLNKQVLKQEEKQENDHNNLNKQEVIQEGGGDLRILKNNRNKVIKEIKNNGTYENIVFKGKPKLVNKKITDQF